MTVTVRFAPSSTGLIHIGDARTALFNWLFALKHKGRFIQRFDDTDAARATQELANAILYDVHWLGIFPEATLYQSRRSERYDLAVERLKAAGVLYPCFETAGELDLRREARLSQELPPVYGREALSLTGDEIAAFEAEGRKPHWRFLLPNFGAAGPTEPQRTEASWADIIRGAETVDLASLSDPVLVRADGTYVDTLRSVVDDIEMGVTHVIRGDDHASDTAVQVALFRALGAKPPAFGYHNLLVTASGDALSIRSLRDQGIEPMAVASLAVLTGISETISAAPDMASLARDLEPALASRSVAEVDPAAPVALNRTILQSTPYAEVRTRLTLMGVSDDKAEAFWLAVRGNIGTVSAATEWWRIVRNGPAQPPAYDSEDDRVFATKALDLLPATPWDATSWRRWTNAVREATGRTGKALAQPLRLALTGRLSGPSIADLMPLLDREEILARRS